MAAARHASRRRYVLLIVVLTAITLITMDTRNGRSGPLGAMGRAAHTVLSPVEGVVDGVSSSVSDWWHGVTDAGNLKRENRQLRDEVAALQGKARDGQRAVDDNTALRAYLKLSSLLQVKNVTGTIVNRDPGNFDPTLTIDKGTESGIAVDMPVMSPSGLVGKVIEAWRGGAKIRVLTDPAFAVGVQTPARPGAPATTGVATGQVGSRELTVEFDPGTKVRVGDDIVTSPLSDLFPPGIPVGTVSHVSEKAGGIGLVATIKPYVDLGGLRYVTVLLEGGQGSPPVFPATTTTTAPASTTTTTNPFVTTTTTVVGG